MNYEKKKKLLMTMLVNTLLTPINLRTNNGTLDEVEPLSIQDNIGKAENSFKNQYSIKQKY